MLESRAPTELLRREVCRVESTHGRAVDHRQLERHGRPRARRPRSAGGVVAAEEDPPQGAGEDVEPGHRVLVLGVALVREGEEFVQPGEGDGLRPHG